MLTVGAIAAFTVQLTVTIVGVACCISFLLHRPWYPISNRKPELTVVTVVAASLYALIYSARTLKAGMIPCWVTMLENLCSMLFFNVIMLRAVILWFNDRITKERFKQTEVQKRSKKLNWFLANKHLLNIEYLVLFLFGCVLLPWIAAAFFWISSFDEADFLPEANSDKTVFYQRCGNGEPVANLIPQISIISANVVQFVMMFLSKGISESLMLKREIRVCTGAAILLGCFKESLTSPQFDYVIQGLNASLLAILIFASVIVPLWAAIAFRKTKQEILDLASPGHRAGSPSVADVMAGLHVSDSPSSQSSSLGCKNYLLSLQAKLGNDSQLYEGFRRHLASEFALENLMFLEASSAFMTSPSAPALRDLYFQYIAVKSEHEINLAFSDRHMIQNKISSGDLTLPTVILEDAENDKVQEDEFDSQVLDTIYKMQKDVYEMLAGGPLIRYKLHLRQTGASIPDLRTSFDPSSVSAGSLEKA
jgi:hypothetical protein